MKLKPEHLLLYAVTDRGCIGARDFDAQIEAALAGGVTCVQLREKHLSDDDLIETARRIKQICAKYGVPLILNDNFRAALAAGADGVHVGAEDTPVAEIRRTAGTDFIIGATAKTVAQAQKAQADGADYLGVGAVFPSPTKTNAVRITQAELKQICGAVQIPCVAIGGITAQNISEIKGCGIAGAAVVSAIFAADDVKSAAEAMKSLAGGVL